VSAFECVRNWSVGTINIPGNNRLRRFTLGRPTQLPDFTLDGLFWLNWGASSTRKNIRKGKAKKKINFQNVQLFHFSDIVYFVTTLLEKR